MSLFTRRAESLGMETAAVATLLNLALSFGYAFGPPLATALAAVGNAFGYSVLTAVALGLLCAAIRWPGFGLGAARGAAEPKSGPIGGWSPGRQGSFQPRHR